MQVKMQHMTKMSLLLCWLNGTLAKRTHTTQRTNKAYRQLRMNEPKAKYSNAKIPLDYLEKTKNNIL